VPLTFATPKVVKYSTGAGTTWAESQDFGYVKVWNGSSWQYIGVRPYMDVPLITFSPAGGTSGSPTEISDYQYNTFASATITASSSVVWTYSGGDGYNGYATVASGSSSSSITFYASYTGSYNQQIFNVSASNGAETKYWYIDITSESFA
jgi:hypothetical protein